MFQEDVTTKDGNVKHVVANSQEELDEAVKVIKNDQLAVGPDITVPGDNAIVSPDNLGVEPIPSVVDNSVQDEPKQEKDDSEEVKVNVKPSKKK